VLKSVNSINSVVREQYQNTAMQRGYDSKVTKDFIKDNEKAYSKSAAINNTSAAAMVLSSIAAAGAKAVKTIQAGNILESDGATTGVIKRPFKEIINNVGPALKEGFKTQFKPLTQAFNLSVSNLSTVIGEKHFGKAIVKAFAEGFEAFGRVLKGFYLSVPKAVRIPALILLAVSTLGYNVARKQSEAKYDAVQYMKDNVSARQVAESYGE